MQPVSGGGSKQNRYAHPLAIHNNINAYADSRKQGYPGLALSDARFHS
jgi:hypothetical protein